MVDDTVNEIDEFANGFQLPLLLLAGFRTLIDALHTELAAQGHPDMRPVHGFALQAIGLPGATSTEIGQRLGVSKQAAGKTVDCLESLGYVTRADDAHDGRRKLVRMTPRGLDSLQRSAVIFDRLQAAWAAAIGSRRLLDLEADLRTMTTGAGFRLDVAGWLGS